MSAMGSVIMASPARLDHARQLASEREHTKTDTAKLEVAVKCPRTAAHFATVPVPHGELGRSVQLGEFFCTGHRSFLNA